MSKEYTQPIIVKHDNHTLAKVFFFVEHNPHTTQDDIIDQFILRIIPSKYGYAGFTEKKYLKEFLVNQIFDRKDDFRMVKKREIDQRQILQIIEKTIQKCKSSIPSKITEIYVFPSYSSFVKNKMNGSSGYSPWKNCMLIFVDSTYKKWKEFFPSTIAHEYLHAITHHYHKWETLLDSLIFEGLAESFVEHIEKRNSPWMDLFGLEQSQKYFEKLKNNLDSKDKQIYRSVFFGNKKYPQWTGYSLGYNIIKSFLNNCKNVKWEQLVKLKPYDILSKSNFK